VVTSPAAAPRLSGFRVAPGKDQDAGPTDQNRTPSSLSQEADEEALTLLWRPGADRALPPRLTDARAGCAVATARRDCAAALVCVLQPRTTSRAKKLCSSPSCTSRMRSPSTARTAVRSRSLTKRSKSARDSQTSLMTSWPAASWALCASSPSGHSSGNSSAAQRSSSLPGPDCPQLQQPAATGRRWISHSTRSIDASWRTTCSQHNRGKSQGRPLKSPGSQPIVQTGLPYCVLPRKAPIPVSGPYARGTEPSSRIFMLRRQAGRVDRCGETSTAPPFRAGWRSRLSSRVIPLRAARRFRSSRRLSCHSGLCGRPPERYRRLLPPD
jgi:hypothetical protein